MNTLTTKFSVLILILALASGSQVKAEKDSVNPDKKETVHIKIHVPLMKFISEAFELNEKDFIVLNKQLEPIEGLSGCTCDSKIEFIIDTDALEVLGLYEDYQAKQLEDWMFEDLIAEEESQPLEDWMFEELITEEEESVLEDWMFDTDYFDDNVTIKDWMLDTEYYNYN